VKVPESAPFSAQGAISPQGWQVRVRYVTPTTLQGGVTRRNRANACVTHMSVTIVLQSASSFALTWTALDSNCDLRAGQSGTDPTYNRL
jgi:hypothetical protein